jgi:hypothetical protein
MNLNEGFLGQKMREVLNSENYFNSGRQPSGFNPSSGFDMGNSQKGDTSYSTGVPVSERHRQFFGMGNRPYTIR